MPTTIRTARVEDVPALQIVRRQSIESNFTDEYERNRFADLVAYDSRDLKRWIESDDFIVLLMETEITPVTYGAVDRSNARIAALYTAPEYEGEGRATEILERLEQEVESRTDTDGIEVTVPLPGVAFFQEKGYEVIEDSSWNDLEAKFCRKSLTC